MKPIQISSANFLKVSLVALLALAIAGFFYFENSLILRMLVVVLGLISLWQINSIDEIILLLTLYLSFYDLYNIHYWRGIPIAIIILAVLLITILLFYAQTTFSKAKEIIEKDIFKVYSLVIGLSIIELFLAMDLWPVDPRTKSLVLAIIFFLISKTIYLYANSMLSFKRMVGFIVVSVLILGIIVILSFFQGF